MYSKLLIIVFVCFAVTCVSCKNQKTLEKKSESKTFTTPLGKKIVIVQASQKAINQYEEARQDFESDPDNIEHIIWYGRRTAYLGKYVEAIQIYTDGIKKKPNDARLYRHRGHRYISIREFDKAITDLEYATTLIKNREDKIEPDGMPNAQNIPISTLHGNIWYHLGLAYYLKGEMEKAYNAYLNCRNLKSNDDNMVSSTHWLYMILRRMEKEQEAKKVLEPITDTMNIIENTSYYNLCKFYKGLLPIDSLQNVEGAAQNDAVRYGLANWYFYNEKKKEAKRIMNEILERKSWNSFGYIAAESDYLRYFEE
ncbi:hypothetical protein U6A24_10425 [Aquimarina gracilis]|uniref:Tetratricopeptide repeat protein n=1 Tax=Aquimarina gracilis TaxID=874422 RepID=A0ABU5ZV98_9FLAO|nr:hypothetical protein [Aquimarina gracilis]MEB3345880.1 hypothetical protein [Aquimarina gracilis]